MKRLMLYIARTDNLMVFERCPSCETAWPTREDFLADPGVDLIGYRVSFADLLTGLFLFQHRCETLVTLHVGEFADLYEGPMFSIPRAGVMECPGYCLRMVDLRPCPVRCGCAFVREIIHLIDRWPKRAQAGDAAASRLQRTIRASDGRTVRRSVASTSS
jgi:hypothetical protein